MITALTIVHVAISLVGIGAGFVVMWGLLLSKRLDTWNAIFLVATTATSVTGFFFPFQRFTPGLALGIVSLILLAPALASRYYYDLAGPWGRTYVITAMIAQYLNVVVLIVQAFQKIPSLRELAPTQSEAPFALVQVTILAFFIAYTTLAAVRFRLEPAAEESAPFESAIPHAREVVNVQVRNRITPVPFDRESPRQQWRVSYLVTSCGRSRRSTRWRRGCSSNAPAATPLGTAWSAWRPAATG